MCPQYAVYSMLKIFNEITFRSFNLNKYVGIASSWSNTQNWNVLLP